MYSQFIPALVVEGTKSVRSVCLLVIQGSATTCISLSMAFSLTGSPWSLGAFLFLLFIINSRGIYPMLTWGAAGLNNKYHIEVEKKPRLAEVR